MDSKSPPANSKSLRPKHKRKVGGQHGHKGHQLEFTATPDVIETHSATHCQYCHQPLSQADIVGFDARQVIDLPELSMQTTEHRAMQSLCSCCHHMTQGEFPAHVGHKVQYGNRFKALSIYLKTYQLMPYERQQSFWQDVFGQTPSLATLLNAQQEC